jgi:hypothetical protein
VLACFFKFYNFSFYKFTVCQSVVFVVVLTKDGLIVELSAVVIIMDNNLSRMLLVT